jgi:CHAT domain-containing protein
MAGVGITLAGAQATLDAWSRGEFPPSRNDGILSASEAAGLRLENTWLVTLSSCDTGIGAAAGGEGVLGLRRGFFEAGAQNLLLTLWPVYEIPTYEFMADFYAAVHKSDDPAAALAEVQKNWLMTMRKGHKTELAIYVAGPFVLNSRGIPAN